MSSQKRKRRFECNGATEVPSTTLRFLHQQRDALLLEEAKLQQRLHGTLNDLGAHTSGDIADQSFDTGAHSVDSQLVGSANKELEEIEAALEKIRLGTYGRCERCFNPIRKSRLIAIPQAKYCKSCMQLIDAGFQEETPRERNLRELKELARQRA